MPKTLLLYPPVSDPTSGYHSLCYLESYARSFGYTDIDIVDANIEAWLHTAEPLHIRESMEHIRERVGTLSGSVNRSAAEELELFYGLKTASFPFEDMLPEAIGILRDRERFFDYTQYSYAVEAVMLWMDALSMLGFPGQFNGFSLRSHWLYNLFHSGDLMNAEVINRITAPYHRYFHEVLAPAFRQGHYRLAGISVTYVAQIPFALKLAQILKASVPDITVVLGGTAVSDHWKHINDRNAFFDIFNNADACILGEGETAFVGILNMLEAGGTLSPIDNVILNPRLPQSVPPQNVHIAYERLEQLSVPDYSQLPWNQYLSPFPFVYYSPSRGCYWNKCTFCDYGLNFDSPTSAWRQLNADLIMRDLREITKSYPYIYFSVDVLAPSLLLRLAERIVEEGLKLIWSAEIRLEEYWTPDKCRLLRQSGCVAVSVGFESGNQRILDLINKGTKADRLQDTIRIFSEAGIGVQIMGFTGFPTEKLEDAMGSIDFLRENRELWTFGGLGQFTLTKGAIVAKEPERFGIEQVRPYRGEDIAWRLFYKEIDEENSSSSASSRKQIFSALQSLKGPCYERPWTGGIDTPHTLFYHERFGPRINQVLREARESEMDRDRILSLNGVIVRGREGARLSALVQGPDVLAVHSDSEAAGGSLNARTVTDALEHRRMNRGPQPAASEAAAYFIRLDGTAFPFPEPMIGFLEAFEPGTSLSRLLRQRGDSAFAVKLWEHSVKHRFLRPADAGVPLSRKAAPV
ncbi:B12-binding domain-containing radical SAM protein [Paenibacillus spiritus]|uniref:B12-binding domain-containing radical SAM protein n=1 Tax=Paenibacillus spiritus TaxID=2496557 RepID=A0A5J5G123_9BACL|nr:radical SAM protein [Paenibacillus spiritus]KAA9000365.1 B12-binding domain-containing radical SAM protein [Paenibacillus spiritus]